MNTHLDRRYAAWQRSGSSCDFISYIAQQWKAYDHAHGITVTERVSSLVGYSRHQDAFTDWLEQRVAQGMA